MAGSGDTPLPTQPGLTPTPSTVTDAEALQSGCSVISAMDYIDEDSYPSWKGDSFSLSGPGTTVMIDPGPNLDFGVSDLSFSVWVYLPTDASDGVIFDKRYEYETVQGMVLSLSPNTLIFQLADGLSENKSYDTAWSNYVADVQISTERWHLISVSIDRDNAEGGQIYVDGRLVATFNPTRHQGSLDTTSMLALGQRSSSDSGYFSGKVMELQFYSCLLTPQHMDALYGGETLGRPVESALQISPTEPPAANVSTFSNTILDTDPGVMILSESGGARIETADFSPDGQLILTTSNTN